MRELVLLIQLNFSQMIHTFSAGKGRKKNMGTAGALLLMAFLALYLSGIYSWLMGGLLKEAGVIEFLLPVMMLLAAAVSLMFSFFAASGIVFGGRDMDFMLSMPVSAFSVMLSKMSALYLENLVFTGLWMIPTGIAGYVFGAADDPGYFLRLIAAILFLPLLPSLIASVGGYVIAWGQARMKHRALVTNLISISLLVVLILLCMQINQIGALLLTHKEEAERLFMTWLAPIGFLGSGLQGNRGMLAAGAALCLAPFLLVTWLFSIRYKKILSSLKSRALRMDYRLTEVEAGGQFGALLQKEVNRLFSTPSYLMNTGVGVVMLIGFSIYLNVAKAQTAAIFAIFGTEGTQAVILLIMAALLSMVYPSAVSISLEGKTLWLLKEAPVPASVLFGAKAGLNLVLAWPAALVALSLFTAAAGLPVLTAAGILLCCLGLTAFLAVSGIALNLHFPKMDCDNDTIVVKQSASAIFGCFGGLLIVAAGAGIWALTRIFLPFWAFCLMMTAVFAILTAVVWKYLLTKGQRLFLSLSN